MRLQIPYNEFEQLLSEYFQQKMIRQIKLAYVDESTIQVSAVVKIKLKVAEATIPVERIAMGCISTCMLLSLNFGDGYFTIESVKTPLVFQPFTPPSCYYRSNCVAKIQLFYEIYSSSSGIFPQSSVF